VVDQGATGIIDTGHAVCSIIREGYGKSSRARAADPHILVGSGHKLPIRPHHLIETVSCQGRRSE
jgi:hypothetical protein